MTTTRKPAAEVEQPALYRCTCKETGEIFYLIKSDSDSRVWYELHFDHDLLTWTCPCKDKRPRPCKHLRALKEILQIRRARIAARIGGDMPEIVATLQREEDERARLQEARQRPPTPARQFEDWGDVDNETRRGFPGNAQLARQSRDEHERRMRAPLGKQGFSLLR